MNDGEAQTVIDCLGNFFFILKQNMHSLKGIISDTYINHIENIGYEFGIIPYHDGILIFLL